MKYKIGDKILYKLNMELPINQIFSKRFAEIGFGTITHISKNEKMLSVNIKNKRHFKEEYSIYYYEVICILENNELGKLLYEI